NYFGNNPILIVPKNNHLINSTDEINI
ncbi:hypothetical protein EZS27_013265, partial [termite gut metagenome]